MLTYESKCCSAGAIKSSSFPAIQLMSELESIKVAHRIVMVDACRNDPTKSGKPAERRGRETAVHLHDAADWRRRPARHLPVQQRVGRAPTSGPRNAADSSGTSSRPACAGRRRSSARSPSAHSELSLTRWCRRSCGNGTSQEQAAHIRPSSTAPKSSWSQSEKLPPPQQQARLEPPRTIFGLVKDSAGVALIGARVSVTVAATARALTPTTKPVELTAVTDEDGFFKIDGIDPTVEAKVSVVKEGYEARTVSAPADQAGKKLQIFVPRNIVAVASAAPAPPAPAPAAPPAPPTAPAASPRAAGRDSSRHGRGRATSCRDAGSCRVPTATGPPGRRSQTCGSHRARRRTEALGARAAGTPTGFTHAGRGRASGTRACCAREAG